ncbi:uncharacterized protein MONOS_8169 [Monocercomonoides exilis]|uniref:uncharacterized protein n=1 Tax=Monocercomonoides exilis TaxID=2049356 RepID=UPI00355A9D38|nr:hypothetical protein MONOS_8169 [Monocercomonoides exilis]|eukprot:MONOS_8169.1-p1 / transcript=MONOS_8169.1 / gene=MONOS_8169 / organism=Monocercomonoides_exilis_PA203 / gene_product=unspecified product / transcript_product=unspecified product / location=Mono_scaffold00300:17977-19470(+) / protein_length=498 / sequence_SO=supercontig / SO=protein_coding / is_pseudo=false
MCEWNGSKITGESDSYIDGISSGGAKCMNNLANGILSISHCSFNDCTAYYDGGAIMCYSIGSIHIENNVFNSCSAQIYYKGGMYSCLISTCALISGNDFQNYKPSYDGGVLRLDSFGVYGSGCIGEEDGEGGSSCVFECNFTSCSLTSTWGGGMYCRTVPAAFKMRNIQFISCSASANGGGLFLQPNRATTSDNKLYCFFLFFHECSCRDANKPRGHDVEHADTYNLYLDSGTPSHECSTTYTDDQRVCFAYNYANASVWTYDQTMKMDWLKDKTIYVSVSGNDSSPLCGANESNPCLTVKKAFEMCETQISLTITLMEGDHQSETATIAIGEKKISVIGKGKAASVIGTSALSSTSTALFSISSGQLEVGYVGIDHNSIRSPSPSVFVVSVGSGNLSLEDVLINSSTSGWSGISSSVFEVALKQLEMIDVEIENMKISQTLFPEPSSAGSPSGESILANVTIRNVNRTTGEGVIMAKSVKGGETFVAWNTTMEECG